MLHALGNALSKNPEGAEINSKKINNYYLFNSNEDGELQYKLKLTQGDAPTYKHLVDGLPLPERPAKRLLENYKYFEKQIERTSLTPNQLFIGMRKLQIVDISLDRAHDNPQLIFESLNSTGLDLTQADLARNYILMGLETLEQEDLYKRYWYPMEQMFDQGDYAKLFDRFMRDYLTVQNNGSIPRQREVYKEFKKHVEQRRSNGETMEQIVADVHEFAGYFTDLVFGRSQHPQIAKQFEDINALRMDVAYPFLMSALKDRKDELITVEELSEIALICESYVFRRAIVGIPTNSLNTTFATSLRDIDKERYLESVKAIFLLKDSYRRFPTDAELLQEMVIKDVYNIRNRNYLLSKLENHERKELIQIGNYTIEHILPQNKNLSAAWRTMLGDDWETTQERYLHTLGNLTLTGYNSELSDRPFLEKRDMTGGFADSPLRLNRSVAKSDVWTAETIQQRSQELAKKAAVVWPAPKLDPLVLEAFRKPSKLANQAKYRLEDFDYPPTGDLVEVYNTLRRRILNLSPTVREEFKKLYIAYKATTNFVDIILQKKRFLLSINIKIDEIHDPEEWCRDVADLGRWGNGQVEVGIESLGQIDYAMGLIEQAFNKQSDEFDSE